MKHASCILLLLLCFLSCQHGQGNNSGAQGECYFVAPDETLDSIRRNKKIYREYLDDYFKNLNHSGMFNGNVLVAKNGEITFMGSYGYSNQNTKEKLNITMPFQLASVSKMFTAIAILQLYEKQQLSIDDAVVKFIPEFPYPNITIRMLLSHRSGLPRYDAFSRKQWDWAKAMSNEDVIALFAQYKPGVFFQPNKKHEYSNTNFAFLASIVERITKKKFKYYCAENIFIPANMTTAFIFDIAHPPKTDSIALGHARGYRFALEPQQDYLNGVVGDKGVYASVTDLYKFDEALYQNKLLKQATLSLAFEPNIKNKFSKYEEYGLGHRLKDYKMNGEMVPYHSGWWRGFKTLFIRDVKHRQTVIMLCNQESSPPAQITWSLLNY